MKSSILIFLGLLSLVSMADENKTAKVLNNEAICQNDLRDLDQSNEDLYGHNGNVIESPWNEKILAIVHSDNGTITVTKNGGCNKTPETSQMYVAQKIDGLAQKFMEFKPSKQGFTRTTVNEQNATVTYAWSKSDYLKHKSNLMKIFSDCQKLDGAIGEAAKAALNKFSGSTETLLDNSSSAAH